jgi:hypothetical protein
MHETVVNMVKNENIGKELYFNGIATNEANYSMRDK